MEDLAQVAEKDSEAYALLQILQSNHSPGSTTFYLRRSDYADKRFLELDLEKIRSLEKQGALKMSDYSRQGIVDPNVIQLDLTPAGQEVLKSRVTTTTQTITETFQESEEPAWKANKRTRDFVRTERGNMIVTMCPEALESDIRGHLEALRDPNASRKTRTIHKIWLSYELNWRWPDISSELRHEMEDYRDLPITRRKKQC